MSLFRNAIEHAENPPATWTVVKSGRRWYLQTPDGNVLESFERKRDAEAGRSKGFYARLYAAEARWFAGEPIRNYKPYVPSVDDVHAAAHKLGDAATAEIVGEGGLSGADTATLIQLVVAARALAS